MRTPQPSSRVMLSPHCTNQMNPVVSSQQSTLCIHCGGSMFFATPNSIPQKTKSQRTGNQKTVKSNFLLHVPNWGALFKRNPPSQEHSPTSVWTNYTLHVFFGFVDLKWLWLTAPIWLPLLLINLVSKKWSNLLLMNAHQDQHSRVLG